MKFNFTRMVISLFAALAINCSEEEKLHERPFPRLTTNDVEEITAAGALLSGTITFSPGQMTDHGFVVDIARNFSTSQEKKFSAGPTDRIGNFQLAIDTDLQEGTTYFVKAFAVFGTYTSFGNVKEFVSLGSKAPVAKSFSPHMATWGDKVTIHGENFSTNLNGVKVKFNEHLATILSTSRDSLVCTVPQSLAVSPAIIQVSASGNSSSLADDFTLISPRIDGISPTAGNIGAIVTIDGEYFNPRKTRLFFGDVQVTPTHVLPTKITFTISSDLPQGQNTIKVFNAEGNGFAATTFSYNGPKVLSVAPLTGTYGDLIKIQVENWLPQTTTQVYFAGYFCEVVRFQNGVIEFAIPSELPVYTGPITVKMDGIDIPTGQDFTLLPPNVLSISPEMLLGAATVQITGERFSWTSLVSIGGIQSDVMMSDINIIQATAAAVLPNSHLVDVEVTCSGQTVKGNQPLRFPFIRVNEEYMGYRYILESVASEDYIFTWTSDGSGNLQFFEFNHNKTWRERRPPPFAMDLRTSSFILGHDVYLYSPAIDQLWHYNAITDVWSEKGNPPFKLFFAESFAANGRGYLTGGVDESTGQSNGDVWEYELSTDKWMQKASANQVFRLEKGVFFGNEYLRLTEQGSLAKYDPGADEWSITNLNVDYNLKCLGLIGDIMYFVSDNYELVSYSVATGQRKTYDGWVFPEVFGEVIFTDDVTFIVTDVTYEFDPAFL
jgi:hypothetical protein